LWEAAIISAFELGAIYIECMERTMKRIWNSGRIRLFISIFVVASIVLGATLAIAQSGSSISLNSPVSFPVDI